VFDFKEATMCYKHCSAREGKIIEEFECGI
jgi:hypothetical protein